MGSTVLEVLLFERFAVCHQGWVIHGHSLEEDLEGVFGFGVTEVVGVEHGSVMNQ